MYSELAGNRKKLRIKSRGDNILSRQSSRHKRLVPSSTQPARGVSREKRKIGQNRWRSKRLSKRTDKNTLYDRNGNPYMAGQKPVEFTDYDIAAMLGSEGCRIIEIYREVRPNGTRNRVYRMIRYVASCGHEHTIQLSKWNSGQGRQCPRCAKPRGEKHFAWRPTLTDEERISNRDTVENITWRKAVYRKDQYTCAICKDSTGGNLEAHHLNSYTDFPQERYNVNNGITLCRSCHKAFHRTYSYHHNTREQFNEWQAQDNTEVISGTKAPETP